MQPKSILPALVLAAVTAASASAQIDYLSGLSGV
jgi:hypothetical protein